MIKNICLGTANFGEKYGLKNNKKINANEIKKFFLYMRKKKITFVDTAFSYKASHKIIKDNLKSDIKIITKLPIPKKKINNIYQWIIRKVIKEQIYFNSQIDTLLLHDTKILNKKKTANDIYKAFKFLKDKKIVNKFGLSVYYPAELDKFIKEFKFDAVELPINIFNREFEKTGWLKKLKKKKITVITRSIFLKGLLLKNNYKKYNKFKPWFKHFDMFQEWLKIKNLSRLEASIRFIKSFKEIDLFIFGFRNLSQLKEICYLMKKSAIKVPDNLIVKDRKLTNPKNW